MLFFVCLGFCISSCIKFAFNFVGNPFSVGSLLPLSFHFFFQFSPLFSPFFTNISLMLLLLFLSHVWPRVIISRGTHTHRAIQNTVNMSQCLCGVCSFPTFPAPFPTAPIFFLLEANRKQSAQHWHKLNAITRKKIYRKT